MASQAYNTQRELLKTIESVKRHKARSADIIGTLAEETGARKLTEGLHKKIAGKLSNATSMPIPKENFESKPLPNKKYVEPLPSQEKAKPSIMERVKRMTEWFKSKV